MKKKPMIDPQKGRIGSWGPRPAVHDRHGKPERGVTSSHFVFSAVFLIHSDIHLFFLGGVVFMIERSEFEIHGNGGGAATPRLETEERRRCRS